MSLERIYNILGTLYSIYYKKMFILLKSKQESLSREHYLKRHGLMDLVVIHFLTAHCTLTLAK